MRLILQFVARFELIALLKLRNMERTFAFTESKTSSRPQTERERDEGPEIC